VRLAAWLAPAERRAEWIAEWIGELDHRWTTGECRGESPADARLMLMTRALGAIPDAFFLRRRLQEPLMLGNDLRQALRTLIRRPGFSAIVILTLSLGIGATTAIFSVVNAVLLRSLPYEDPERLVVLRGVPTNGDASKVAPSSSWPDYVDLRDGARSFAELAAVSSAVVTITGSTLEPAPVISATVTANLFHTLAVAPELGRGIASSDEPVGAPRVVVISHALWRTRLGGDSARLGETLTLDGIPHTIVGIMPATFGFPEATQLWVAMTPQKEDLERGVHRLAVVGRLRPEVTRDAAEVEAKSLFARLEMEHPESNAFRTVSIDPMGASAVRRIRPVLLVLFGAVGLVLLIVCTNVASLFLARAASREREVALRLALGAGRGRIARQLLVESVLLSVAGGLIGLVLALWGVHALVAAAPSSIPRASEIGVDVRVLGFVLGLSLLTGIAFGAVPAFQLGGLDANGPLKDGSHAIAGSRATRRLRKVLVVAEVSLAMVLVIGAGLLLESIARLQRVEPGFDPERLLVTQLKLPPARYPDPARIRAYYDQVQARVSAIPGAASVALAFEHPMSPGWTTSFTIAGRPVPPEGQAPEARMRPVTPGYFRTAGVRLLRGRDISDRDRADAPGVVVINEAFAKRHFPSEDPIGQRLQRTPWWPNTPASFEIVGVIRDERFLGLSSDADPATYFPHAQLPFNDMYIVLKTRGEPAALIPMLRSEIWAVDRDIPLDNMRTMDELVGGSLARPRFVGMLLSLFAAAALLLAAIGIYGVLSYTVAQRTPEIGIRMALGAQQREVLRSVVGQGMALAALGIALGAVAAVGVTRALSGMLFGITPTDPVVFAGVAGLLAIVAAVAAYIPARKASMVDPLIALRQS
jgi:predicted permease